MPEPLTLEESVASLKTRPGLRVELVAAEPLVKDPINLDWGADGKLWVVEMTDYPLGLDGKGSPGGRVRFLEDSDADGRYDRSTVFLEGLNFPTSVRAWRNGVLVIACPEILYAEDTDGDGIADRREVLFRGFREGNQQHRVNGLEWALDGWLVIANGDSGGTVESVKTGESLDLGSFDLRIHPDSGRMERLTGRTQYGRVRDDFGNWFGCSNSRPFFHFSLNRGILTRNPHVVYPGGALDIDGGTRDRQVFPLSEGGQRYNNPHSENWITSACGLAIHRDPRLGDGYLGNAFICEPVHNLVHRRRLEPEGTTFKALRAEDESESEFLASSDHWFRPTAARTGPDGGLWVVDMHRYVIEHPEWIPQPWQDVLDLRAGHERGRIYRVVSDDCDRSHVPEDLTQLSPNHALPQRLASPNGTARDRAHQRVLEQAHAYSHSTLRNRFNDSPLPEVRLQCLYALHALNGMNPKQVVQSLEDPDPKVLVHALRLAFGEKSFRNTLEDRLPELARIDDIGLHREIAIAAGELAHPKTGELLASLALKHADDPAFVATAMSSLVPHLQPVTEIVAEAPPAQGAPLLPYLLETAVAMKRTDLIATLLEAHPEDLEGRFRTYATLLSVIDRRRLDLASLLAFPDEKGNLAAALEKATDLEKDARRKAADAEAPLGERLGALILIGRSASERDQDIGHLLELLGPSNPRQLQEAAARRLLEIRALAPALEDWDRRSPAVRKSLISGALSDRNQAAILLTSIENGALKVSSIDAASRERLLSYPQSALRMQAKALFGELTNPDRSEVIERFLPALKREGQADRGKIHFQTLCSVCHELGGLGRPLGPDLGALADKSPGALLSAILDPNQAVEDKYRLYQAERQDGSVLAGMIASESGNSLVIQQLDGSSQELLRTEIKTLKTEGRSAMPEGLEAALDLQGMADLIAFLRIAQ